MNEFARYDRNDVAGDDELEGETFEDVIVEEEDEKAVATARRRKWEALLLFLVMATVVSGMLYWNHLDSNFAKGERFEIVTVPEMKILRVGESQAEVLVDGKPMTIGKGVKDKTVLEVRQGRLFLVMTGAEYLPYVTFNWPGGSVEYVISKMDGRDRDGKVIHHSNLSEGNRLIVHVEMDSWVENPTIFRKGENVVLDFAAPVKIVRVTPKEATLDFNGSPFTVQAAEFSRFAVVRGKLVSSFDEDVSSPHYYFPWIERAVEVEMTVNGRAMTSGFNLLRHDVQSGGKIDIAIIRVE